MLFRSHLEDNLIEIAATTANTRLALVHGDVSSKNILVGPQGPVFLDAECAWYGDPAFDLAFCLNHLLLKCLWVPVHKDAFLRCYQSLTEEYLAGVGWESEVQINLRAGKLVVALLLARVDGKSPVEYLTAEADKAFVRDFVVGHIFMPPSLEELWDAWRKS